jgi:hypothetical protein
MVQEEAEQGHVNREEEVFQLDEKATERVELSAVNYYNPPPIRRGTKPTLTDVRRQTGFR